MSSLISRHTAALLGSTALPTLLPRTLEIRAALERPLPIVEAARRHGERP